MDLKLGAVERNSQVLLSEFFKSDPLSGGEFLSGQFPQLNADTMLLLNSRFKDEEVANANVVKETSPFEAPGPDDYQAIFF